MNCSWKAVILLALASIAIQYTAIRTLSGKSFQICPIPSSPMNCSLGVDMDAMGRTCEDTNAAYNASRKTQILLLATTRSGSSFVGQLLNQHPDVFYLFEPLYHVQAAIAPRLYRSKNPTDRRVMLGASRDLLRSLCDCDLDFMERYIKPTPVNHTTDQIFRRGVSKALCTPPVCDAYGQDDININEAVCLKKCPLVNLTRATDSCREHRFMALKIVRIPEIGDLRVLVEDPRVNVKVIQLVRDPRGILSSRMEVFKDSFRLWRIWKSTGRKPYNLDVSQSAMVCEDFLASVSTGLSRPPWLKGKYMLLRFEDLAMNPLQKTKEMFQFLGLSLEQNVVNWIEKNTRGGKGQNAQFGTLRDSATTAETWRLKMTFDMVDFIQNGCQEILLHLGYKAVSSSEELKNMSHTLIQEKTFLPF